jgi:hypothetical protein
MLVLGLGVPAKQLKIAVGHASAPAVAERRVHQAAVENCHQTRTPALPYRLHRHHQRRS